MRTNKDSFFDLWGGGRVVMALCLGSYEQIRSSKERGFDPRPPQKVFCHVCFLILFCCLVQFLYLGLSYTHENSIVTFTLMKPDMTHPVAITSPSLVVLINSILKVHTIPITLVICATRESFLQDLQTDLHRDSPDSLHPLLVPTIHLLATTRTIRLAFTPTLGHLRAYLATYQLTIETLEKSPRLQGLAALSPMLLILGLVALHSLSTEFSAQGLSRSLAMAVEAADNAGAKLVLAELRKEGENGTMDTGENLGESETAYDPWRQEVSLLNGSVRFGEDSRPWSGRTVEVRTIVGRWCKFEGLEAQDDTFEESAFWVPYIKQLSTG